MAEAQHDTLSQLVYWCEQWCGRLFTTGASLPEIFGEDPETFALRFSAEEQAEFCGYVRRNEKANRHAQFFKAVQSILPRKLVGDFFEKQYDRLALTAYDGVLGMLKMRLHPQRILDRMPLELCPPEYGRLAQEMGLKNVVSLLEYAAGPVQKSGVAFRPALGAAAL